MKSVRKSPTDRTVTTPPVPRLLGNDMAAAYLGVSERTFDHIKSQANFPLPIRFGRRTLWDRKALDVFIDRLSAESLTPYDPWDDVRVSKAGDQRRKWRRKKLD